MALQFSSSIKTLYAFQGMMMGSTGSSLPFSSNSVSISIYSGDQPAANHVVANWSSLYRSGVSNTPHLVTFNYCGWTRTKSTITMTTFPPSSTPLKEGTATWAIVWGGSTQVPNNANQSTGIPAAYFVIVPVTTTSGDGVIRFTTVNFTTTQPVTMIDAGFTIM